MNVSWNVAIVIGLFHTASKTVNCLDNVHSSSNSPEDFNESISTNVTILLESCFNMGRLYVTMIGKDFTEALPAKILDKFHNSKSIIPALILQGLKGERVFSSSINSMKLGKSDAVLLFSNNTDDHFTSDILSKIRKYVCWGPKTKLLVVAVQPVHIKNIYNVESLFRVCWKNNILHVGVLVRICEDDQNIFCPLQMLSYNPFKSSGNTTGKISRISAERITNNTADTVFSDKLLNLHGYHMKVSMFDLPPRAVSSVDKDGRKIYFGSDGEMIQTIVKYMNAVPEYFSPADKKLYGFKLENGTYTGSRGDVLYGRADIAGNSDYWTIFSEALEFVYPHSQNDYCIVAPKSKQVPLYKNLFLPFSKRIWLLLITSIVFAGVFWYVIEKYDPSKSRKRKGILGRVVLETIRSFLTGMVFYKPTSKSRRIFLMVWVSFSMVMTNAFQGSLTSYLALPEFLPEINTLKELDTSGLPVYLYPGILQLREMDNTDVLLRLSKKFLDEYNYTLSARMVAKFRNASAMMNRLNARFTSRRPEYIKEGIPLLHVIPECALQCYDSYKLPLNSPFLPRLDTLIRRIIEAGLPIKWFSNMYHASALKGFFRPVESSHKSLKALSLEHLQTAFYILIFGLVLGAVSFVFEKRS